MKYLFFIIIALPKFAFSQEPLQMPIVEVKVLDEQLTAYNSRNLEAFLACYSDSVYVMETAVTVDYIGKKKLKRQFRKMFRKSPDLHCEIKSRTLINNLIVDKEYITGIRKGMALKATVAYEIKDDIIVSLHIMSSEIIRIDE